MKQCTDRGRIIAVSQLSQTVCGGGDTVSFKTLLSHPPATVISQWPALGAVTCCLSAALGKGSTGFGVTPASSRQVTRGRESPSPPCRVRLSTQDPRGLSGAQAAQGRHPVSSLFSQLHLVCEPDQGGRLGWKPPVNLQGSARPGTEEKQGLGRKPERKLSSLLTAFPGETLENQHSS